VHLQDPIFLLQPKRGENERDTYGNASSLIPPPCHDPVLVSRKALLLGVLLAKFDIGKKIMVSLGLDSLPIFSINDRHISERELLKQVKAKCYNNFKLAVQFCLIYDSRMVSEGLSLYLNDIV
jgi:hypothetical protein